MALNDGITHDFRNIDTESAADSVYFNDAVALLATTEI